jgi:lysophospholipase L1-like esterase
MTDAGGLSIPRAMNHTPLPTPPAPDAETLTLVDAMLEKRPIDPALYARHSAPEAIASREAAMTRRLADDWAGLARYRAANADVRDPALVMIGDSLTEIWGRALPGMFGERILNRGIAGQTSQQILLRFMSDVVDLRPERVHILCGTNDVAGNTGPTVPEDFQRNIRAMAHLAEANRIDVLLGSVPPAAAIFWSPDARPLEWIPRLNGWLKDFAIRGGHRFIDYYAALDDGQGALKESYSADGVHVTRLAYRLMTDMLNETDTA